MGLFCTFAGALRSLRRWLGRRPAKADHGATCFAATRLHTVAGHGHVAWPSAQRGASARRPLRVLRIVDASHAPSTAGRMVMSGRLADVCAELDRLVAAETATA